MNPTVSPAEIFRSAIGWEPAPGSPAIDKIIQRRQTLFEIGDDIMALFDLIDELEGDITECEPVIDKWFAELNDNAKGKLDGYAAIICELEARAKVRSDDAKRLATRADIDARRAVYLRERMRYFFTLRNIKKMETERYTLSLCGNGGKAPLVVDLPPERLPDKYRKAETIYKQDSEAIRKDLEAGVVLDFARLKSRGNRIQIK